jgi:enoyl-CoA hydratase/carnithine racemase
MGRTKAMADLGAYKDAFPHAKLTRSVEGVLEVVLHTKGGSLIFNGYTHEEFVDLFHQINQDEGNRVVILTGAGKAFIDRASMLKVSISSRRADMTKSIARARRCC